MALLSRSSPTCARAALVSLAAFMDAVAIVDPVQYQRRRDERDDVSMPLRSLHFGPDGGGLVRLLVIRLMISCWWSRSSGSAVSDVWLSPAALCHRARTCADRP
jgi:hypothetical protein